MSNPVVVWGVGQLGAVFAHGFLRQGWVVCPVTRDSDPAELAECWPNPELVLVAVTEQDLDPVLHKIPHSWRNRLALLQNELVPACWQPHLQQDPSICVVWFEKRPQATPRVVLPSVCYGRGAALLSSTLHSIGIPARTVITTAELHFELALKNLYILTINIAGLVASGDVATLWRESAALTSAIASDVIRLQTALMGEPLDEQLLLAGLQNAIVADPEHSAKGRFAKQRLQRCLAHADRMGLDLVTLRTIADSLER